MYSSRSLCPGTPPSRRDPAAAAQARPIEACHACLCVYIYVYIYIYI